MPLWRKVLPFVLAVGLIGWVLSRVDWPAFVKSLSLVSYPLFGGFIAAFIGVLLVADSVATVHVYRRSVPELSFKDFLIVRGASYLPSLLNHHVGQAWITWFMSRRHGVDLKRMAGATLLVYATWAGLLALLACVAFIANDMPIIYVALIIAAGLAYLAVIYFRPNFASKVSLLQPLFEAGVGGHISAMAFRLPHLIVLFVGTWVPFLLFGADVPLAQALTYIPLLMVVVTLPLTPLGVGTRDALAVELLSQFVDAPAEAERIAAIAACTTTTAVAYIIYESILGLLLLRRASRLLAKPEQG